MDSEEISHSINDLPEGAIVEGVFEVVGYMEAETGKPMYVSRTAGDISLSSMIGLIELGKMDMIEHWTDEMEQE